MKSDICTSKNIFTDLYEYFNNLFIAFYFKNLKTIKYTEDINKEAYTSLIQPCNYNTLSNNIVTLFLCFSKSNIYQYSRLPTKYQEIPCSYLENIAEMTILSTEFVASVPPLSKY